MAEVFSLDFTQEASADPFSPPAGYTQLAGSANAAVNFTGSTDRSWKTVTSATQCTWIENTELTGNAYSTVILGDSATTSRGPALITATGNGYLLLLNSGSVRIFTFNSGTLGSVIFTSGKTATVGVWTLEHDGVDTLIVKAPTGDDETVTDATYTSSFHAGLFSRDPSAVISSWSGGEAEAGASITPGTTTPEDGTIQTITPAGMTGPITVASIGGKDILADLSGTDPSVSITFTDDVSATEASEGKPRIGETSTIVFGSGTDIQANYDGTFSNLYPNGDKPADGSVTGSISKGSTITISGSGFGTGPTVGVYSGLDGATGQNPVTGDPLIGTFETGSLAYYQAGGADGDGCLRVIDGTGNDMAVEAYFAEADEIFISYRYKSEAGSYFPSINGDAPDSFQSAPDSCLKMGWFGYGPSISTGKNDFVMLSANGAAGQFGLLGNDISNYWYQVGGTQDGTTGWWRWNTWMRFAMHMKAGADPVNDNGTTKLQIINGSTASHYLKDDAPVFDADTTAGEPNAWNYFKLVGWARGGAAGTVNHTADDIYIASGANSAKRVELANHADYSLATKSAICPHQTWSDGEITATVEVGDLDLGSDVWLHVLDNEESSMHVEQVLGIAGGTAGSFTYNAPSGIDDRDTVTLTTTTANFGTLGPELLFASDAKNTTAGGNYDITDYDGVGVVTNFNSFLEVDAIAALPQGKGFKIGSVDGTSETTPIIKVSHPTNAETSKYYEHVVYYNPTANQDNAIGNQSSLWQIKTIWPRYSDLNASDEYKLHNSFGRYFGDATTGYYLGSQVFSSGLDGSSWYPFSDTEDINTDPKTRYTRADVMSQQTYVTVDATNGVIDTYLRNKGTGVVSHDTFNGKTQVSPQSTPHDGPTRIFIPGYVRGFNSNISAHMYYADIFYQWGDNALARVEITDSATYSTGNLVPCEVTNWTATEIQFKIRTGVFHGESMSGKYVHVHDADNLYIGYVQL